MATADIVESSTRLTCDSECEACRMNNRPGKCVVLFGKIRLNAATDDFVIFGYIQSFGRIVPLSLLGLVLMILRDIVSTENTEAAHPNFSQFIFEATLAVITLIVVSFDNIDPNIHL